MNQQVKDLIQKLGEAIHESVSESDQISGVVREIREQGFDVLLMLEATIGLNEVDDRKKQSGLEAMRRRQHHCGGPFTRHDLTFLKSLRITTEEEERADSPGYGRMPMSERRHPSVRCPVRTRPLPEPERLLPGVACSLPNFLAAATLVRCRVPYPASQLRVLNARSPLLPR